MNAITVSPEQVETGQPLKLSGLLAMVEANASVPKRLGQDIRYALRKLAQAQGCPITEAAAEPIYIRTRLKDFAPASLKLKPRSWATILSLYGKALSIAGLGAGLCEKRLPLSDAWRDLLSRVPAGVKWQRLKWRITSLARFCSSLGIRPEQITDSVLKAYRAELEKKEWAKRPQDTHRALCVAWNEAVETVPGWPQVRVAVPQYRNWYSLDWELLPQSLRDELEEYLYYQSGDDLLHGSPEPFRPATLKSRRAMLRAYFTAALGEEDPAGLTSFAEALKVERFEKAMLFFASRGDKAKTGKSQNKELAAKVADAIVAIAHHWPKAAVTKEHLEKLLAARKRLRKKKGPRGMGEKSRTRVRQFRDGKQVIALAKLPLTLWARLPASGTPTYAEALMAQKAVAIELLLRLALRIQNVSDLEIGRHITWSAVSRVMQIHIPADEVKNDVEITRLIPPDSAAMIEEYIERYRPVLLKASSNHLFPGTKGGPKQKGHLSTQISACIKRETGLEMHCHLFRHFAAYTYLGANPGDYGVIRLLHGHKSVNTTTTFYCDGAEAEAAFRQYDEHLAKLRDSGRDGTDNGSETGKTGSLKCRVI
jgi:integrase